MSPPPAGLVLPVVDAPVSPGSPDRASVSPLPKVPHQALPEPPPTAEATLEELHVRLATHPFWDNRLLGACRRGHLTCEDFALVFSQYALLTRSASRFVHALMARCDSEPWCARLTQVLWEEVGATPPEKRQSALFRRFLRDGLGVDAESIRFHDATRYLVRECTDFCLRASPCAASAFLALGLEAPVPRLYGVFAEGLHQAGVADRHLAFFHRHMEADSARATALEELVLSHAHEPGWADTCLQAMEQALSLLGSFLEGLFEAVQHRRLGTILERIQAQHPLAPERPDPRLLHLGDLSGVIPFYRHTYEQLHIDFTVDRVAFPTEVLDTNLVRIAPGHTDETQQHAHEALLVVLAGTGQVRVRETVMDIKPGDAVFIPRWASHQAQNTGTTVLTLLTVTDYGLTRRAYVGDVLHEARLKRLVGEEP